MKDILLENIKADLKREDVHRRLKIGDDFADEVDDLLEDAKKIANPKAIYTEAYINGRGEDTIEIDKTVFESRLLCHNLADVFKVYPYVNTCGIELYEWAQSVGDPIMRYWADSICEMYLGFASRGMKRDFELRKNPGKYSSMNPGSLEDWPISQQPKLFSLFETEALDKLGVSLTPSFLMIPVKSVSGIMFQTEKRFENCMLCERKNCPGRRAEYSPEAVY